MEFIVKSMNYKVRKIQNIMNKKLDVDSIREFRKFYKVEYKKLYMLIFVVLISSILEAIVPLSIKFLTDEFINAENLKGFKFASAMFFLLVFMATFSIYGFYVLGGKLEYKVAKEIRKNVFLKVENFSLKNFKKYEVGELLSRLTSDVQKLSEVFSWGVIDAIHSLILLVFSISIMFYLSVRLTIFVFLISPLIYLISTIFQSKILKHQRQVRRYNALVIQDYTESVTYTKTIKSLGIEDKKMEEFLKNSYNLKKYSIRSFLFSSIFIPSVMFFASFGVAIAFNLSSIMVMNNVMTYGAFLSFLTYSLQLFEPFRMLAQILSELKSAEASAERIFELINTKNEFDVERELEEPNFLGDIVFEKVSFKYEDDTNFVLDEFDLTIKAGTSVALVGSTGSGKSTIVNLLCKFYEATEGNIFLNGVNYKDIDSFELYEQIGYVLQSPQLFSTSVMENIRVGNLNARDEEIFEVCELLGIKNFIENLPNGFDTFIGEKGHSLSNGEKQLISFARALIRKPKLLLLDEATSSIDTETEKIIQNKMGYILENKTAVIVAHRLSTIKDCDIIIVIEKGKIIEKGSHQELLDKKGKYYKLYMTQELGV